MLVPDEIWVTANYKETQLDRMRPGQPVDMEIDAYPERDFHGHVASVQPGSGPAFSLLPPENATGNYVKIVQRVPVKIILDNPPTDVSLGPGMSVVPTVRVDPKPSLYEKLKADFGWLAGARVSDAAARAGAPAAGARGADQPLDHRHSGRACGLHGGARHHDRQRGPALYRRRHGGQHRRSLLGGDDAIWSPTPSA